MRITAYKFRRQLYAIDQSWVLGWYASFRIRIVELKGQLLPQGKYDAHHFIVDQRIIQRGSSHSNDLRRTVRGYYSHLCYGYYGYYAQSLLSETFQSCYIYTTRLWMRCQCEVNIDINAFYFNDYNLQPLSVLLVLHPLYLSTY